MLDLTTLQPFLDWLALHPNLAGFITFVIAAAESLAVVGILVPGVFLMLGIGALIGLDAVPLWSSLLWAVLGAVAGDGLSYWLGRHFDQKLRHLWPLSKYPDLIPKGEQFFLRHGASSVLFGRFVGPVRPIIPAVAGIMHMPATRFYLVNILSAIAWAPVVLLPGVAMGASLSQAADVAWRFAVATGSLLLLLWFFSWLIHRIVKRLFARQLSWIIHTFAYLTAHPYAATIGLAVLLLVSSATAWQWLYVPPTAKIQVFDETRWWQADWELFGRQESARGVSANLQWMSELRGIQSQLRRQEWYDIQPLSIKNATLWFAPTPQLVNLPLPGTVESQPVAVLMGYAMGPNRQLVLTLWSAQRQAEVTATPLWFGELRSMQLIDGPYKSGLPRVEDVSASDRDFIMRQLQSSGVVVKRGVLNDPELPRWWLLLR